MQAINTQELEVAIEKYGEVVVTKNSKNNVIIMSIEDYKNKLKKEENDKVEQKLLKAEQQIKEGKTVKATEVFKELEKEYGF